MQRTITVVLDDDADVRATVLAFRETARELSPVAFADGSPLSAISLQKVAYATARKRLSAQLACTVIRRVAGAYASARSNKRPATRAFTFARSAAMWLVGKRGRDADFRADGTLSIWTVAGRKRIGYRIPTRLRATFDAAIEYDALTICERDGKLIAQLCVTLPDPPVAGTVPVGVDLGATNAVVASDHQDRTLFISGKEDKVRNARTRKTRSRLQRKMSVRKAEGRSTRSVRRVLKRLGRTQANRTRDFARCCAKELCAWAPRDAVLVLEGLRLPQPSKRARYNRRAGTRRKLSQFACRQHRTAIESRAQRTGLAVAFVNPAYTSQDCSRCGLRGVRRGHQFVCLACGLREHADVNASRNIRDRFTALRRRGPTVNRPRSPGSPRASSGL